MNTQLSQTGSLAVESNAVAQGQDVNQVLA